MVLNALVAQLVVIQHIGVADIEGRIVIVPAGGNDFDAMVAQATVDGVQLCIGHIDIFERDLDIVFGD